MKDAIYNITSGEPKTLAQSTFWATLESIARLLPAVIAFYGIFELFESYQQNRSLDTRLYLYLILASVVCGTSLDFYDRLRQTIYGGL